ncbi:MAG: RtcB family protein [Bacillota bacterium]
MTGEWTGPLERVGEHRWLLPKRYKAGMLTDGLIYADGKTLTTIRADQAPEQVANVACLPGIVGRSLAMPDIHWGYGFPIGGVAATRRKGGVISPGGVGYDINCGVRLLSTALSAKDIAKRIHDLMDGLFKDIPSGVGVSGRLKLDEAAMDQVLEQGARWAVEQGYGFPRDLDATEEGGAMKGADSGRVSPKAKRRGLPQLGTLGSGNHFVELEVVDEVYDQEAAEAYGLQVGQVCVAIHTGSRGLGHQVCTDYLEVMARASRKYGIALPDRQLACAPLNSPEGEEYLAAMAAAANYAWANRQCLTHWVRQAVVRVLNVADPDDLKLDVVYDVAHNIAKLETHTVDGEELALCVHRKGATRAFPRGHRELPAAYRHVGQPVLVPGDMGRASYVLAGAEGAMAETFGSACHGAGRLLSRTAAKKGITGATLRKELASRGIVVRAAQDSALAEEAPDAYKDVDDVVRVTHEAGLARRVARLKPLGVMKG